MNSVFQKLVGFCNKKQFETLSQDTSPSRFVLLGNSNRCNPVLDNIRVSTGVCKRSVLSN